MKKFFLGLLFGVCLIVTLGVTRYLDNQGDVWPQASALGQESYFAATAAVGVGDCSSWTHACTFRTAVAKCSGTKLCMVYVGAGLHDLNNGSDANGTTIDKNYVQIQGVGASDAIGQPSVLMNSRLVVAGGVDYILRVTGNQFSAVGIVFDNTAQNDKNITMLNMRGSYSTIKDCLFRQNIGDGGGTGILADNAAVSMTVAHSRFRRVIDYGINVNDFTRVYLEDGTRFLTCGIGLYLSHANAGTIVTDHTEFYDNTTAMNLTAGQANKQYYVHTTFANNATNITDFSAYGGAVFFADVIEAGIHRNTYPAGAGVDVAKDAAAWAFGLYVDIIPAGTIKKPFRLETINLQNWSAAQTFKIELFYGSVTPGTTSLGVYEVVCGDPATKSKTNINLFINTMIPAYATLGAKLMSSTDGVDSITVTLGYELL